MSLQGNTFSVCFPFRLLSAHCSQTGLLNSFLYPAIPLTFLKVVRLNIELAKLSQQNQCEDGEIVLYSACKSESLVTAKKILVAEDEKDIHELITYNLKQEGYEVISTYSGEEGLKKAVSEKPDLILLDIMLPGINGLDVCRELKSNEKIDHIPVVMLTAKNEDVDIITGLELGADDYMTKPFSPRVLIARIRAILRRGKLSKGTEQTVINIAGLTIDEGRHEVLLNKKSISLTLTEFQILLILAKRPGWVFSRAQLIDELREGHHVITDRAIDVQITNLRKKLKEFGKYIETVRGIGYRMRENI